MEDIMSAIEDLTASVESLKSTDEIVLTGISGLKTKIQELTDIINATANVDPQIVAATDAINAEIEKLKNAL